MRWSSQSPQAGPGLQAAKRSRGGRTVWITAEDMSPNLGCYGAPYTHTPNLDELASRSVRYTRAFATAPVCSPARCALITGVWPNSLGTPHLRNRTIRIPERFEPFPLYLREEGYYCTNNAKMDYNYDWPDNIWDESSHEAHWRNRPDPDQPFFAVFNFVVTHQSRVRPGDTPKRDQEALEALTDQQRHDPARAPVPPYYPNTPTVRQDIARHYDTITVMDQRVGRLLGQLEEDGLADETIVFFYSDHGRGMPRGKRWLQDSGMKVPLIVHFPKQYQHLAPARPGEATGRLVSFIDFAPTILSLLEIDVPAYMDGMPFLGQQAGEPRQYVHGARDRVDEVIEVSRSVRDGRYLYIRNYMPHRPAMQYSRYSERTPTRGELRRRASQGRLVGPAHRFMLPDKPPEQLFDTKADPHNVHNLAGDPEYAHILHRLRNEQRGWSRRIRDVTLIPEPQMLRRAREAGMTIFEWRKANDRYAYRSVLETAEFVGRSPDPAMLIERMGNEEPAVRYWAATAAAAMGGQAYPARDALTDLLDDPAPSVRIAAAEAVTKLGRPDWGVKTLRSLLTDQQFWTRLHAGAALRYLREEARAAIPAMRKALDKGDRWPYLGWQLRELIGWLEDGEPRIHAFARPGK